MGKAKLLHARLTPLAVKQKKAPLREPLSYQRVEITYSSLLPAAFSRLARFCSASSADTVTGCSGLRLA